MICNSIWLVVFDDYDMHHPIISAFKSKDKAMEHFKFLVKAHEYENGVIYVDNVDLEE